MNTYIFYLISVLLLWFTTNASAQTTAKKDIYIPLKLKPDVVQLEPLLDTLEPNLSYHFTLKFAPKFIFSELYLDKGVAVRTDSFVTIKALNKKKNDIDTANFRIIGFANNSRILLVHRFVILPDIRVYPVLNKKHGYIILNNDALERNLRYKKASFTKNSVFSYEENGDRDAWQIVKVNLSVISQGSSKNLFTNGNILTENMHSELHKAKAGSYGYVRLDLKNGKKNKTVWTRFLLE